MDFAKLVKTKMKEFKQLAFISIFITTVSNVTAAKNTTILLQRLRALMKNTSVVNPTIDAYIVPSEDAHMSEHIAPNDARKAFISGFTGNSGMAIITESKATMWTDSRYHLQARKQLDKNWEVMKEGTAGTPTKEKWLNDELPRNGRIGVDPRLLSRHAWEEMSEKLKAYGHSLVPVWTNLVDLIWDDKPNRSQDMIFIQKLEFAGVPWQDKVSILRKEMEQSQASALVVSDLNDLAWLLNLRGTDVPYTPVFFAYLIVTNDTILFFIDETKLSEDVKRHLNTSSAGNEMKVIIRPYDQVINDLRTIVQNANGKIWVSPSTNQAISEVVPPAKLLSEYSPVIYLKAVKNDVELQGMRKAHIRDGVAMCEFLSWLEKEVPMRNVTEIEAADYLEACRRKQENYFSLSFKTISASGSHSSLVHYKPTPETDKVISPDEIYLIDTGAQYLDGTTDITRTIHFKTPTEYEKECFTAVLKGHIAVATLVFPNNITGQFIDSFARQHLWKLGLDFSHGAGHGVGSFLDVHEELTWPANKIKPENTFLKKGMVTSDEPGYYEDDKFGIRIENIFTIIDAETKYNYKGIGFLKCDIISFVPLQTKLINKSMMSEYEIKWVNDYNRNCREIVGPDIQRQGLGEAYQWLLRETMPM